MSVVRHTSYNVAGALIPLAVSIVTVPLYIKVIGTGRYGLLAICWLLVGYFGLFDFGLGRATAQKIARLADASSRERSSIFWTSALMSLVLSLMAILAFAPLAKFGLGLMRLDPHELGLQEEVGSALPFLVAALPFGIAQSVLVGALEGRQKFLTINLISSAGTIATSVLPLMVAIWSGPDLPNLLAASLVARSFVFLLLVPACVQAIPVERFQMASSRETGRLLGFGGWTTVSNVVGPLMVFWDRFAIGAILGSTAVAVYVVPFNLVWQVLIVPGAIMSALFPRLASAELRESRRLASQAISALAFAMTPSTLLMIFAAPPFLTIWLGPELGLKTAPIACILLLGVWINSFARVPHGHILARGEPKLTALLMISEIIPYAAMFYLLVRLLGLPGAALAWSVRCAVDSIALFVIDRTSIRECMPLLGQSVLMILGVIASLAVPNWSPFRFLVGAVLLGVAVIIVWTSRPRQVDQLLKRIRLLVPFLKDARSSSRDF
ncbi:flippase [Sphingomonas hankyongi]|uniref:Flippase n=1 Tax=Sphingomonas hankyongi TaxID=2908209 RepID=A0ABT0S2R6_9SPHN|nr:flippase [Sphingomonas hankyongi]MCL6730155.1 flippase [Sphingomonas hankyongi]